MSHEVFISYSSQDKTTADAICARLEEDGIRCWYAPRDILPGESWPEALARAIDKTEILVIVFSGHSNDSKQVAREVELAARDGKAIVPFRIEDVKLSPGMEYFLSQPHWLDALSSPLESHIDKLGVALKALLARNREARDSGAAIPLTASEPAVAEPPPPQAAATPAPTPAPTSPPTPAATPSPSGKAGGGLPRWLLPVLGGAALLATALGILAGLATKSGDDGVRDPGGNEPLIADGAATPSEEVTIYQYGEGSFARNAPDSWLHYDAEGHLLMELYEYNADDDWHYVIDRAEGSREEYRLPVGGGVSQWRLTDRDDWQDSYDLTDVTDVTAPGEYVVYEHDTGSFTFEDPDTWYEYDGGGVLIGAFTEWDTDDEWYYLLDLAEESTKELRLPTAGGLSQWRPSQHDPWADLYFLTVANGD